uniref:Nicolin 1, tubulin polyglutamylase complex subunit n=1 Tax=Leptobrachium leishanense TaxID=445787 RepID=A0A8C5PCL8_9ANUR
MDPESVPCTIKLPVPLQVGDVKTDQARPGVYVIDVTFPKSQDVDLQEISFKNYYTAFLTVRIQQQRRPSDPRGNPPAWRTCIKSQRLMPNPHMEDGSQDYVSLRKSQMICGTDHVTAIRLILRQPSPVWLNFTLEDLQINPSGKCNFFAFDLSVSFFFCMCCSSRSQGLPDPNKVSSEVQQMWALTEVMKANQSTATIGRFDVSKA